MANSTALSLSETVESAAESFSGAEAAGPPGPKPYWETHTDAERRAMHPRDYVDMYIAPALFEGLRRVTRERPGDACEFLGKYLLHVSEHSKLVHRGIPPKPRPAAPAHKAPPPMPRPVPKQEPQGQPPVRIAASGPAPVLGRPLPALHPQHPQQPSFAFAPAPYVGGQWPQQPGATSTFFVAQPQQPQQPVPPQPQQQPQQPQ